MVPPGAPSTQFLAASVCHGRRWRVVGALAGAMLALLMGPASAQEMKPAEATPLVAALRSEDMGERIDALRELQVTLDPRLPEALLPMLRDEGESIRPLAARGIGSRWWQIPAKRRPVFIAELERMERAALPENDWEDSMVARALGLLRRDYRGAEFSRSRNRRWVIYERYSLPCLIDTKTGTEELLGGNGGASAEAQGPGLSTPHFAVVERRGEQPPSAAWHPRHEWVALALYTRRTTSAWMWRHGAGLQELKLDRVVRLAKLDPRHLNASAGWSVDFRGWEKDLARYECSAVVEVPGEEYVVHTIQLTWDPAKDRLHLLSHEQG